MILGLFDKLKKYDKRGFDKDGINSKNISKYGQTGADIISVGSITNSVKGIDMSLEI